MKQRIVSKQKQDRYDWDHRLVQLSLEGDEKAWEMLYDDAYAKARGAAYNADPYRILHAEDVEEIAREALEKCYQKREQFRPENLFSTWVGGFARNITKRYQGKYYRRFKKEQVIYYESLPENADPLRLLLRKERNYYMWLTLEMMEEPGRSLFMWYQLKDISKAQARKKAGIRNEDMEEAGRRAILQYRRDFWNIYPGYEEEWS